MIGVADARVLLLQFPSRQEDPDQVLQPVDLSPFHVVNPLLFEEFGDGPAHLIFIGVRERVPMNIRKNEVLSNLIVRITWLHLIGTVILKRQMRPYLP